MRIPRIYTPQPLHLHQEITLDSSAASHVCQVLRLRINDTVKLFNGNEEYLATLTSTAKKQAHAQLTEKIDSLAEPKLSITLAQALPRADKMDFVLQKATELGVKKITPLHTERSQIKLNEKRLQKRLLHWQKIIISACEQSGRCFIPTISTPFTLIEWISNNNQETLMVAAHPNSTQTIRDMDFNHVQKIMILIGPEGGFSEEEVLMLKQSNCQLINLGPRVLRTETASIAMIAILQALQGDI